MVIRRGIRIHHECDDCGMLFERMHKEKLCPSCREKHYIKGQEKVRKFYIMIKRKNRMHYYLGRILLEKNNERRFIKH
jgi:uncharacterized Zn finger protein (UPF0148 family)